MITCKHLINQSKEKAAGEKEAEALGELGREPVGYRQAIRTRCVRHAEACDFCKIMLGPTKGCAGIPGMA